MSKTKNIPEQGLNDWSLDQVFLQNLWKNWQAVQTKDKLIFKKEMLDKFLLFALLTQWNNAFLSTRETSSMKKYKGSDSTELTIVRPGQEITTKSRYLKFKRPHILSRTK